MLRLLRSLYSPQPTTVTGLHERALRCAAYWQQLTLPQRNAVAMLNRDATISFDIDLAQLDAATQSALLAALAAGTATMVTKGDAPGSAFQAFPLCAGGVEPTAGGCVRVETFDALGEPTGGPPARVRFSNVVGHFSTWAVAIVTPASGP